MDFLVDFFGHCPRKKKQKKIHQNQERKFSPKRKFSAGHPCGHPAKNFGQALQILEKQAFRNGHPTRTSMKKLRSEKLRADFSFPTKESTIFNWTFWPRSTQGKFCLEARAFAANLSRERANPALLVRACFPLVAPYCAIPRDYLSDTPLLRAMGFLVSQHGQLGAIPPPPFQSISPLESIREVEVRYPPLKRGISAILARYPMKTGQMGAIPPCAILSRKGIARYGGVSRTGPLSASLTLQALLFLEKTLKTVTSLNKEARLPKFHFS